MKALYYKLLLLITVLTMSSGALLAQVNWTKHPVNPILTGGPSGSWNRNIAEASVLYNADSSRFEMWFVATSGSPVFPYRVGFAKSYDGLSWEMHSDPVLNPGSAGEWDSYTIEFPSVIRENGQYKMWYSSGSSNYIQYKIGLATSPDGINWTKNANNPILGVGTEPWEAGGVMACCVMPVSGGYKMWYTGLTTAGINDSCCIGYANSTDGISWQRNNNPVLVPGSPGEWDDTWVFNSEVLHIQDLYYMWYVGTDNNSFLFEIGLATSYDGINWAKHSTNPVLQPSVGGWDGISIGCGTVLFIEDSLCMWYHGQGSFWQIGLATSSPFIPVTVKQEIIQPTKFLLQQNFPNPFNPSTVINYQLPIGGNVAINVYDILGNEVATLVNEYKPAGKYEVTFDSHSSEVRSLPSGVYFYQLKAGEFISTKKMLLIK